MDQSDQTIRRFWVFFPALLFCLLYLPNLGVAPLSLVESMAALGSIDSSLLAGGGRGVVTYPLYPFLAGVIRQAVGNNEWAVRLPSVLAMLGMTVVAGLTMGLYTQRREPIVVAMLMAFSPAVAVAAGRTATGQGLTAFLISSGWFAWYYLGRRKHRWSLAWASALALTLLAAFHTGPKAFVIFYFPLMFMRRPFKIWRRLRMPQHLACMLVAFLIFVFWFQGQMRDSFLLPLEFALTEPGASLRGVLAFPFHLFLVFLPAPLFFWPGFCAAFRPLEKNREMASFLRTLIIPLFLVFWLIPPSRPSDLLVLVVPLALLAGMHYEILVRRYAHLFNRIMPWLEYALALLAGIVALSWLLVLVGVVEIEALPRLQAVTALAAALGAGAVMLEQRYCGQPRWFWLRTATVVVGAHLLFATSWQPINSLFLHMPRKRAEILRQEIPGNQEVYKLTALSLPREAYYLQRRVVVLDSPTRLSGRRKPVFVLGGYNPPMLEQFDWNVASPLVDVTVEYYPSLEWRPARWTMLAVRRRQQADDQHEILTSVRIYHGLPRPQASDHDHESGGETIPPPP